MSMDSLHSIIHSHFCPSLLAYYTLEPITRIQPTDQPIHFGPPSSIHKPFLSKVLHFEDRFYHTCSHCIPLLFGGVALTVYSFTASEYEYGHTLYELFPARSPVYNSSDLEEILINLPHIQPGHARSASHQALLQFILLIATILTALFIGALTALVAMRVKLFDPLGTGSFFADSANWHVPLSDVSVFGNESNANLSNCTDACDRGGKDESIVTSWLFSIAEQVV